MYATIALLMNTKTSALLSWVLPEVYSEKLLPKEKSPYWSITRPPVDRVIRTRSLCSCGHWFKSRGGSLNEAVWSQLYKKWHVPSLCWITNSFRALIINHWVSNKGIVEKMADRDWDWQRPTTMIPINPKPVKKHLNWLSNGKCE